MIPRFLRSVPRRGPLVPRNVRSCLAPRTRVTLGIAKRLLNKHFKGCSRCHSPGYTTPEKNYPGWELTVRVARSISRLMGSLDWLSDQPACGVCPRVHFEH